MPTPTPPPSPDTLSQIDAKLSQMLAHMEAMDKRDKLRTVGGFFRALINLIPIILLVWTTWYFYAHGEELMEKIAKSAAEQAQKSVEIDPTMFEDFRQMVLPKQQTSSAPVEPNVTP